MDCPLKNGRQLLKGSAPKFLKEVPSRTATRFGGSPISCCGPESAAVAGLQQELDAPASMIQGASRTVPEKKQQTSNKQTNKQKRALVGQYILHCSSILVTRCRHGAAKIKRRLASPLRPSSSYSQGLDHLPGVCSTSWDRARCERDQSCTSRTLVRSGLGWG